MVLIPYGVNYSVTLKGQVPRLVQCEQCAYEYVYILQATGEGYGSSTFFVDMQGARDSAYEGAEAHVRSELEHGCAAVPCAQCGHLQAHMFHQARSDRFRWMKYAVIALFALGGILFLPAMVWSMLAVPGESLHVGSIVLWVSIALVWAAAGVLTYNWQVLCQRYDPNSRPVEERKRKGNDLSVSKAEFLKMYAPERPPTPPVGDSFEQRCRREEAEP